MAAGCVGSYIGKGSCEAGAVTTAFDHIYNANGGQAKLGNGKEYDLPQAPQWLVDGAAGFGAGLSFGLTNWANTQLGTRGNYSETSTAYQAGEWGAVAHSTLMGYGAGLKLAGTKGAGLEFSHWIPNRFGGPRSPWNGNFVTSELHALTDPFRYQFMPRVWKASNEMYSPIVQQLLRIPYTLKGIAAGFGYGITANQSNSK